MSRPIAGKAEFALEYPSKSYVGILEQSRRVDAHPDKSGMSPTVHRTRDANVGKPIRMHLRRTLLAINWKEKAIIILGFLGIVAATQLTAWLLERLAGGQ